MFMTLIDIYTYVYEPCQIPKMEFFAKIVNG